MDVEILIRQLHDLGLQMDAEVDTLGELDMLATALGCTWEELREAHDDDVAEWFLRVAGSVEQRKMEARLKAVPSRLVAHEAKLEAEKAKSRVRTQQAKIRALDKRIEIGRSFLSLEKTRMELDRLPGRP